MDGQYALMDMWITHKQTSPRVRKRSLVKINHNVQQEGGCPCDFNTCNTPNTVATSSKDRVGLSVGVAHTHKGCTLDRSTKIKIPPILIEG